jgi:tRNA A37 threonylcarbamoyladenosine dehydratase
LLQTINSELNAIKDKIGEKKITLKTESSQHVDPLSKVRFFSSRIQIDSLFSKFLGYPLVIDAGSYWFYS